MTLATSTKTILNKCSTQIAVTIAAIVTISSNFSPQVLLSISSLGFLAYAERQRCQIALESGQKARAELQSIAEHRLSNLQQQLAVATHQITALRYKLTSQQQTLLIQESDRQELTQQLSIRIQAQQQLMGKIELLSSLRDRLSIVNDFNQQSHQFIDKKPDLCAEGQPMTSHDRGRIAIFIDGENLRIASETLGYKISPIKLRKHIRNHMIGDSGQQDFYYKTYQPGWKLNDRLELEAGFRVIRKERVRQPLDKEGKPQWKGNQDVELACNMLTLAIMGEFDTAVLVAADRDYIPVVQILQRLGCRVELIFWEKASDGHPQTPQDLIRVVGKENYTPMEEIKEKITFPCLDYRSGTAIAELG